MLNSLDTGTRWSTGNENKQVGTGLFNGGNKLFSWNCLFFGLRRGCVEVLGCQSCQQTLLQFGQQPSWSGNS